MVKRGTSSSLQVPMSRSPVTLSGVMHRSSRALFLHACLALVCAACATDHAKLPLDDAGMDAASDASPDIEEPDCTCDELDECCDGCLPISEGGSCSDGDPNTFADACSDGVCVGPCECDTGPCCDGCHFLDAGTICDVDADYRSGCSTALQVTPGVRWYEWGDQTCSGATPGCDGDIAWKGQTEVVCELAWQECRFGACRDPL
jgi:hypothetical protein